MRKLITPPSLISRRSALVGALAATGCGVSGRAQDNAGSSAANACRLFPAATEGPYYFDPMLRRSDITEGKAGSPLHLVIGVLGADCSPLSNARVDVWHCDAQGTYSGYAGRGQGDARGETFLRGWQPTNGAGEAAFDTLFPGWYGGRTTHIHLKVILNETDVLTSQLYFPDELNDAVYREREYARPRGRDTRNADDGIRIAQGDVAYADVEASGAGHVARMWVAVDPDNLPAPERMRGPPRRGQTPIGAQRNRFEIP